MTTELKVSMAMGMATAMVTAMGMAPTVMDIMKTVNKKHSLVK